MNNYLKGDQKTNFAISAVFGIVIGFAVILCLMLLSSFIMASTGVSAGSAKVITVIILCVSALVCGYSSAKRLKSKVLIIGAVSGALFYFTISVISAAVTKSGFTRVFLVRLIISVIAAAVGAFLSTVSGRKNKYIK